MVRDYRFRGFTLAHVELVEARDDGTVTVIGLSGSGDAVAMVVQADAIDDLVSRLQAVRPLPPSPSDPGFIPTPEPERPIEAAPVRCEWSRP